MTTHRRTEPTGQQANRLAERYGRLGPTRRTGVVIAVATACAVLAVVVGWIFVSSQSSVQAALLSWEEPRGDVLTATVEIHRPAGVGVTCDLVAVDDRRVIVGQLELEVPPGPKERLRVPADIPLEGDGIVPRLVECRAAD